jgi:hypothetical protein
VAIIDFTVNGYCVTFTITAMTSSNVYTRGGIEGDYVVYCLQLKRCWND